MLYMSVIWDRTRTIPSKASVKTKARTHSRRHGKPERVRLIITRRMESPRNSLRLSTMLDFLPAESKCDGEMCKSQRSYKLGSLGPSAMSLRYQVIHIQIAM
mmetsp:Transcript_2870/g.5373  ORF Transcript_2870/g.5373 Transcript_2870/m.5373 type:complete len:102 (+) Transcript_2870:1332-1637(+)